MKKHFLIYPVLLAVLGICTTCETEVIEADFEDTEDMSIYSYLLQNDSLSGPFLKILEAAGIARTLSAYNPQNEGYTLFLPDSVAVYEFIERSDAYGSLQDLLNDTEYVTALARYHVVRLALDTDNFPFGALPEFTMSGDLLTINFVIETDTSYYKINNQAPVSVQNIELSNGYIHVISRMLEPIVFTTYDWISSQPELSIFTAAVDATGFEEVLSRDVKLDAVGLTPVSLLAEPDSVFQARGINSFEDLAARISPGDEDYENPSNKLHGFVGYHILDAVRFLDDFEGEATNYSTFSEVPVNINGSGIDILINKGKMVFDTLVNGADTTIIDYVKFYYDVSNVITLSGSIHFIDQVLEQQRPSPAIVTFEFWEEPLFNEFRTEPGEHLVEDPDLLQHVSWTGPDLVFVKSPDSDHPAWNDDYLFLEGNFTVSYTVPRIVQGSYTVFIRADGFNERNALVEVFIDGKKIGSLVDLSNRGNAGSPYQTIRLGNIAFASYETHTVEVRSMIPGRFCWDHVRFEPVTN